MKIKTGMIKDFIEKDRGPFPEHDVKRLLRRMGISVPKGIFIKKGEVIPSFSNLKYPLAAKVSSVKITSKSDVKGIRLGLSNDKELQGAVTELSRIEDAEGVLIEEMAPQGVEVIVGGVIDRQFGPVVMFGLGGVFVEVFKDVAFGLAPLAKQDALRLIQQVKGYRLLEGYRGKPPVDKEALIDIIVAVSEIMASGQVEEIDLNPVALYAEGAVVLDAKMSAKQ